MVRKQRKFVYSLVLTFVSKICGISLTGNHLVKSILAMARSNRPEVLCKKDVLRNFAKFTGEHLCQSLFPVKLVKFLRTPFFIEHPWWLLLNGLCLALSIIWYILVSLVCSVWSGHVSQSRWNKSILINHICLSFHYLLDTQRCDMNISQTFSLSVSIQSKLTVHKTFMWNRDHVRFV